MNYYPLFLDVSTKKCLIVGGGDVAERKVERLLACGAHVIIVGRTLTPALERMKKAGVIDQIHDDYDEAYIHDAFLIIGATDCDDINARISEDAKKAGLMVNIVDDPQKCDFILPSLFQRGDLTIAISTGGKSPALAKKMRQEMEDLYGPEYGTLVNLLGAVRRKIKGKGTSSDENKRLFESLVNSDILEHIRKKDWDSARKTVFDITGENIENVTDLENMPDIEEGK